MDSSGDRSGEEKQDSSDRQKSPRKAPARLSFLQNQFSQLQQDWGLLKNKNQDEEKRPRDNDESQDKPKTAPEDKKRQPVHNSKSPDSRNLQRAASQQSILDSLSNGHRYQSPSTKVSSKGKAGPPLSAAKQPPSARQQSAELPSSSNKPVKPKPAVKKWSPPPWKGALVDYSDLGMKPEPQEAAVTSDQDQQRAKQPKKKWTPPPWVEEVTDAEPAPGRVDARMIPPPQQLQKNESSPVPKSSIQAFEPWPSPSQKPAPLEIGCGTKGESSSRAFIEEGSPQPSRSTSKIPSPAGPSINTSAISPSALGNGKLKPGALSPQPKPRSRIPIISDQRQRPNEATVASPGLSNPSSSDMMPVGVSTDGQHPAAPEPASSPQQSYGQAQQSSGTGRRKWGTPGPSPNSSDNALAPRPLHPPQAPQPPQAPLPLQGNLGSALRSRRTSSAGSARTTPDAGQGSYRVSANSPPVTPTRTASVKKGPNRPPEFPGNLREDCRVPSNGQRLDLPSTSGPYSGGGSKWAPTDQSLSALAASRGAVARPLNGVFNPGQGVNLTRSRSPSVLHTDGNSGRMNQDAEEGLIQQQKPNSPHSKGHQRCLPQTEIHQSWSLHKDEVLRASVVTEPQALGHEPGAMVKPSELRQLDKAQDIDAAASEVGAADIDVACVRCSSSGGNRSQALAALAQKRKAVMQAVVDGAAAAAANNLHLGNSDGPPRGNSVVVSSSSFSDLSSGQPTAREHQLLNIAGQNPDMALAAGNALDGMTITSGGEDTSKGMQQEPRQPYIDEEAVVWQQRLRGGIGETAATSSDANGGNVGGTSGRRPQWNIPENPDQRWLSNVLMQAPGPHQQPDLSPAGQVQQQQQQWVPSWQHQQQYQQQCQQQQQQQPQAGPWQQNQHQALPSAWQQQQAPWQQPGNPWQAPLLPNPQQPGNPWQAPPLPNPQFSHQHSLGHQMQQPHHQFQNGPQGSYSAGGVSRTNPHGLGSAPGYAYSQPGQMVAASPPPQHLQQQGPYVPPAPRVPWDSGPQANILQGYSTPAPPVHPSHKDYGHPGGQPHGGFGSPGGLYQGGGQPYGGFGSPGAHNQGGGGDSRPDYLRVSSSKMTTGWSAMPHAAQQGALSAFSDVYNQRRRIPALTSAQPFSGQIEQHQPMQAQAMWPGNQGSAPPLPYTGFDSNGSTSGAPHEATAAGTSNRPKATGFEGMSLADVLASAPKKAPPPFMQKKLAQKPPENL